MKAKREPSCKEPGCSGISIWKLTKTLVLDRDAMLGFKRRKVTGAPTVRQRESGARNACRVAGIESFCGLGKIPQGLP